VDFQSLTKTHFPDDRFAPVHDIAMEATRFIIPHNWEHPIFMLYDAHDNDLPGIKNLSPRDKLMVSCDARCSHRGARLQRISGTASELAPPYHQAVYAPDVTLAGYGEVPAFGRFSPSEDVDSGFPGREMEVLGIGGEGTSLVYFRLPEP
jgi:hypothetical protein